MVSNVQKQSTRTFMKKKLKIAVFFSSSPDEVGGVQEHVHKLGTVLRELGHQVDVFGPQKMLKDYPYFEDLIVSQKDVKALARVLTLLLHDKKIRSEASRWASKKSRDSSWEETAKQTVDFYRQCIPAQIERFGTETD